MKSSTLHINITDLFPKPLQEIGLFDNKFYRSNNVRIFKECEIIKKAEKSLIKNKYGFLFDQARVPLVKYHLLVNNFYTM